MNQIGAVIVFQPGVTKEQVLAALGKLMEQGVVEHSEVNLFNPDQGYPVWYVP